MFFIFLLFEINYCQNNISSFINDIKLKNINLQNAIIPKNNINIIAKEIGNIFKELIEDTFIKDALNHIQMADIDCLNFLFMFVNNQHLIINEIAKQYMRNRFISYSIEIEGECIESDKIFFLFKGKYSLHNIYKDMHQYKNQYRLFCEKFIFEQDLCLWKYCHALYINDLNNIIKNISNQINTIFKIETTEIEGINYKVNGKNKYENKGDFQCFENLKVICFFIIIIIIMCTLSSFCMEEGNNNENENDINKIEKTKEEEIFDKILNDNLDSPSENVIFAKKKEHSDKLYKFLSAFSIIKNLLLFNKIKEPLSDQNSLIELSSIIFLILFSILLAENTYIIIKFIDQESNLYAFFRDISFIPIKIGSLSYEFYKIICGLIFGFKFIN